MSAEVRRSSAAWCTRVSARASVSSWIVCRAKTRFSQVVDSNPYSRLMALQRMGVVADYERIRAKTVAIVVRAAAWWRFAVCTAH